ncbi:hypothetical protein K431DRAFT_289510 [Polychaeton citri CBS 116435]|uniref:U three protein 23 n=1 Tax=Polychaeton citri CBS 116435 TaxID=1314669 RepID=A0A9P4Q0W6_9PEZI|nr:hypothetical protein K431DRAFT_289510 [Polychaeton citri CBS 116435]
MRAKRSKQYRKLMNQYAITFGFREPYQVLIDSGIIIAAARYKMRLGHLLQNTLHGDIKPMITQCCIRHLYNHPAETDAEKILRDEWIGVAKSAERRRCGHHELENPLSELECVMSCVDPKDNKSNKHKYIVASEDVRLRQALREVAGVPLIYINRSVMILEPMAGRSEDVRNREESGKMKVGFTNVRAGKRKREEADGEDDPESHVSEMHNGVDGSVPKKVKKARGPKGPNPLSVKKPKKENTQAQPRREPNSRGKTLQESIPHKHVKSEGSTVSGAHPGVESSNTSVKRKRKRKHSDEALGHISDGADGQLTGTHDDGSN